ncbi:uncharacterized protein LOC135366636 [Ornithodoros turicata]|uniref:uncharacterized protein LOC135366636 n=1 Tax=Ornithodoros turicata TaxID=34597 RepID=UPI0031389DB9
MDARRQPTLGLPCWASEKEVTQAKSRVRTHSSSSVRAMLLFILFLLPLIHGARAECRPEYRKTPGTLTHTACKPLPSKESCQKVASGISTTEKKKILELHNKLRSQAASGQLPGYPAATNMYQLKWDNELADVAQAHSDQCVFKHDQGEERFTTKFPAVGQNLAYSGTTDKSSTNNWPLVIQDWFDEYKLVSASVIRRFSGGSHGHFTQVVWAKTQYVGCGLLVYNKGNFVERLYTCNYGPAGNYLTESVYDDKGASCSKCPGDAPCDKSSSLCVSADTGKGEQEPSSATNSYFPFWTMFVVVICQSTVLHYFNGLMYSAVRRKMGSITTILMVVALSTLVRASNERCRQEYKKGGGTHTACKPPNNRGSCQKREVGVSEQDKKTILRVHNELRRNIARGQLGQFPQGANMIKLEWNDELAAIAQAHAELCRFAHDDMTERFTTQFKMTGQNLATSSSSTANDTSDWPAMINNWFDEYKDAPVSVIRSFRQTQGRPIGHFTQVVWAKTRFVGCGYNSYSSNRGLPYRKLYTCNYAKTGNVMNHAVYKEGEPCSQCVAGAKCDNGLCDMTGLPIGGKPGAANSGGSGGSGGRAQQPKRRPSTSYNGRRGTSDGGNRGDSSGGGEVVNSGQGANGVGRGGYGDAYGGPSFMRPLRFGGFRFQ